MLILLYFRREFGLERFVPISLMESMKRKELRKLLSHLLKLNQTMTGSSHKCLTSLQAKLYYLSIISELPSYGAKCFSTNIRVSTTYHFCVCVCVKGQCTYSFLEHILNMLEFIY